MVGDTSDLARLDVSRLLLQGRSSELHGRLILPEVDGSQGTLLGACKVKVDTVAANFVFVIVPTLVA